MPPSNSPFKACIWRFIMHRRPVNKGSSAAKFRRNIGKTKKINFVGVMRGGIRL